MKILVGQKGQGSIEIVLITATAIALAFFFSNVYLSTQDATAALWIAKNRLTERLNSLETPVIIEKISYTKLGPSEIAIRVFTKPNAVSRNDLWAVDKIEAEIRNSTSFSTASICINAGCP